MGHRRSSTESTWWCSQAGSRPIRSSAGCHRETRSDTYRIRIGIYDSGEQKLLGGNVQIHKR